MSTQSSNNINDKDSAPLPSSSSSTTTTAARVVDVGVNLTNAAFRKHWRNVVQRSIDAGVDTLILTGTDLKLSQQSLEMCKTWQEETGKSNLYCTIGIHPHDAKHFRDDDDDDDCTINAMKELLQHPLAVAVGECGLDYNRNFSTKEQQINAFKKQVELACALDMPLFLHEREAHDDLIQVLDQFDGKLPPVVIHCFTGTEQEAMTYIERGYYIGFTGTICKKERGAPLREILPKLPLDRIVVETDAPFMGFKKGRRGSEPADCFDVAVKLGQVINVPTNDVCDYTTKKCTRFFSTTEIIIF